MQIEVEYFWHSCIDEAPNINREEVEAHQPNRKNLCMNIQDVTKISITFLAAHHFFCSTTIVLLWTAEDYLQILLKRKAVLLVIIKKKFF